jgi:hypothetical protein
MWPMLLDMPKRECKIELRKLGILKLTFRVTEYVLKNFFLELEAFSIVVSTFRAQGNLNQKKIQLLKELETLFKYLIKIFYAYKQKSFINIQIKNHI